MKKRLLMLAVAALCACTAAAGHNLENSVRTRSVGDVTISCKAPGEWSFKTEIWEDDGKEYISVAVKASAPSTPPQFEVAFALPQGGIHHLWEINGTTRFPLRPDWAGSFTTNLAKGMPLFQFFGDNSDNRLTVACDEVFRDVVTLMALREEGCEAVCRMSFFTVPEAPMTSYKVTLMLDGRDVFWADCIREASLWMSESSGCVPCRVPEAAYEPLYSSWYQFHQNVYAPDIEAECALASSIGMRTVIVDDGWQTDDSKRGYAFCGDWKVSENRFPDFPQHVDRVREMGIKYMLWYSVPFIGIHSENYRLFEGKYLYHIDGLGASVLDPRFPEVRGFLVDTYVRATREWGLDGFKLDFIDSFTFDGHDPALDEGYAGRDILTVPAAVNKLMTEVRDALQRENPDVLIEFRQAYVGPAIAQYGNMFRVGDCPGDPQQNRIGICNLRLGAPSVAVHSDMIEWNLQESPSVTATSIISALFGVIQYSVMLRDIPEAHTRVIRHWLEFSKAHRDALLKGYFRPYHPEAGYPLIEAGNSDERIIAVYLDGYTVPVPSSGPPVSYVINASGDDSLVLDLDFSPTRAHVYDIYGNHIKSCRLKSGLSRITVPSGGHVRILRR